MIVKPKLRNQVDYGQSSVDRGPPRSKDVFSRGYRQKGSQQFPIGAFELIKTERKKHRVRLFLVALLLFSRVKRCKTRTKSVENKKKQKRARRN